jgi:hypothetical protein
MARKSPKDKDARKSDENDPNRQSASDPDRERGGEDTTAYPGEERQSPRSRNEPDADQDVE